MVIFYMLDALEHIMVAYGSFLHMLEHGHVEQEILVEPAAAGNPANPEQVQGKPRCISPNNSCLLF
jgi:hypothetical protein